MKIYVKTKEKFKNHKELIKFLFKDYVLIGFPKTYSDKECKVLQCMNDKMRSFDDIYHIAKTYFPTISHKTVFKTLLLCRRKIEDYLYYPTLGCCSTMRKIRFTFSYIRKDNFITSLLSSILTTPSYDSLWSWKELASSIGLTNKESLDTFFKNNKNNLIII